ncbi:hypothetical protein PCASD_12972 [Puccinia coronata f. sp. avenae]|uniref:Uncharacterized protein n=1 Tax=Puccinia coronata f. sp. avenae TaxID=200324 RepID=A0A2N5UAK4_9BASI|nr:hypothetical protein PCASD_12972 [Puccinia coronata f. sp. avenae]
MQMAPPNSQMIGMDPQQFQLFCNNSGNAAHNFQMATQAQLNQWVACRQSKGPPAGPPDGHGQIPVSPANHPVQPAAQPQRSPSSVPATGMPPAQPPNERRAIIPPPEPVAHSKRLAPASKDWKKSVPKGDIIWKTGMTGWTWRSFIEALIRKLVESRQHEHFGKHLTTLDKDNNLKWKCIVTHHRVYGVKSHAFVSNKAEFEEFAKANEAKELALTYGDKEERASLEKTKTRLACNPKANVTLGKQVEITKNLMAYILRTYETTAESMRVRDPKDKNRSIRIPHNGPLHIWARAILMKAAGVDFQNPLDMEDFPSEKIKVWTCDERTAENAKAHTARASPNETGVSDSPSGTCKHSEATDAKSNGPKNTPPGTRKTFKPKASTV